jgi:adenylosuccinate synthase
MTVTAVVGAQWGDEGKGKVVDYLAEKADLVIRFQGGANAGHTIVNPYGTFKQNLVPSGIFYPHVDCLLGPGVLVDPTVIKAEVERLQAAGVNTERLWIAERAHVVLPHHKLLDRLDEESRGNAKIGTTLRGVGPAATDKAGRRGLQVADLLDVDWLATRVRDLLPLWNRLLGGYGHPGLNADDVIAELAEQGEWIADRVVDSLALTQRALRENRRILLEGQLGVLRDLDWGTYPYVTSSNPLAGGAAAGAGLPPWAIKQVVGVTKAYTTAVGTGPFPTEDHGDFGNWLREHGGEYGAVTGRPRRCGWLDGVALRYAVEAGGITELALTKLDVLAGLDEVQICTGYRVGDTVINTVPPTRLLEQAQPVYESLPGWGDCAGCTSAADLPEAARRYVKRVEEIAGVPVKLLSVGAAREATLPV